MNGIWLHPVTVFGPTLRDVIYRDIDILTLPNVTYRYTECSTSVPECYYYLRCKSYIHFFLKKL